ncbi:MAG: nuclear transport factor 2 family protein [Mycobacterium sp.]
MDTPAQIAEKYFAAWKSGNTDQLRELLAEDVDFVGALATAQGAEDCINGLVGMRSILTDIEVHARIADANDVITWFDLHTSVAPPTATANWTHVEDGKIKRIRVTFDPRAITQGLNQPTD